jgi:hypothetical protein
VKLPVVTLPAGQYFCGICGSSLLFDAMPRMTAILEVAKIGYTIARCQGWHCAFKDAAVKIPLTRIECDVLEENPRDAPAARAHPG